MYLPKPVFLSTTNSNESPERMTDQNHVNHRSVTAALTNTTTMVPNLQ